MKNNDNHSYFWIDTNEVTRVGRLVTNNVILWRINILTLNPEYFDSFLNQHLIAKAIKAKLLCIKFYNFRNYALDKHHRVDDYIYGGGPGMLLKCEPIYQTLLAIKQPNFKIILTPTGNQWDGNLIRKLITTHKTITIICGRYEGFDERIYRFCDLRVAVGRFIVSNGELLAMTIIDSLVRNFPNLISSASLSDESFSEKMLYEYPQYTRPRVFQSYAVPSVILSGNHRMILEWKTAQSIKNNNSKKKITSES